MSAARRLVLATMLMSCFALALTASAARAQVGVEPTPHAPVPVPPVSLSPSTSLEPLSLGMPLRFGASLAAYRWFEMAMGQIGFRRHALSLTPQGAARSAWLRKRS